MKKKQNIQLKMKGNIHKSIGKLAFCIAILNVSTVSGFYTYEPKLPEELTKIKKGIQNDKKLCG